MGAHRAEHSEEAAATPQACFDAVVGPTPGCAPSTTSCATARSVEGEHRFEPVGDGRARPIHRLAMDPGGFVPGAVEKVLVESVMEGSVRDLEAHVERA